MKHIFRAMALAGTTTAVLILVPGTALAAEPAAPTTPPPPAVPDINVDTAFLGQLPSGLWLLIGAVIGALVVAAMLSGVVGGGAQIAFSRSDPEKTARGMATVKNSVMGSVLMIVGGAAIGTVIAFVLSLF